MKPILYAGDETAFTSNGLGRLADVTRCLVTEERNGVYLCEFDIPVTSPMYSLIQEGRYVGAIHDDRHDLQPFEIYARSAPIDGLVTFYAHHVSYKLRNVILKPFEASSCAQALQRMQTQTYNPNPFTFWTDKDVSAPFKNDVPASCRSLLAGQEGSILDVYGTGEYEFDLWAVKLHLHRGGDSGVSIRYGVNLTDIEQETDISESYSAIAPFWRSEDGETVVTLPEGYVVSPNAPVQLFPWTTDTGEYMTDKDGEIIEFAVPQITVAPVDMSGDFEEAPTEEQLRQLAVQRLASGKPWLPKENIKISFVDLAHTEDYKDVAALQRVSLCDRVNVYCGPLGVAAESMQVARTVYNVLAETYDEMELGEPSATYADAIMAEVEKKTENMVTRSAMEAAVDHATRLITGGLGGYVVFNLNADGQPEEILIMDAPDTATAVEVWRFNKNGLGHSHSGYGGPFSDVALTADGQINATMITTGVLLATLIKAGVLSAANNDANYWNLETGEFMLKSDGASNGIVYKDGKLHINASDIDVGTLTANVIKTGILQDAAGMSYWNMLTGAMNIVGSFAATTTRGGSTYTVEITDGVMSFKKDGATFGTLYPDSDTFNLRGSTGMNINIWTSSKQTGGASITLDANGNILIYATDLTFDIDALKVGNSGGYYQGYNGFISTGDGELEVHEGIITGYTPFPDI